MGGAVSASVDVSTYSIINSFEIEDREDLIGQVEVAIGAGMMAAPILGGLAYSFGHFAYPFWVCSSVLILMYPICQYVLKEASREA